ncbi:GPD1 [Lepeophtheirus salmonis]|uniref:GPD1 n=1 Tax=Lepeophtheirus salmonis TaxID=72036 RepID=A0A7R8D4C4_LEPSM|nr:GPD1 [Lepeophtheirus salmonis]CAF2994369.1 GPD1 [Lepeophtheirus salmonis]
MIQSDKSISIIGSGNWGSTIARIIGSTVLQHNTIFKPTVNMWVKDELIDGKSLVDIINQTHENVKYLPGKLKSNVKGISLIKGFEKHPEGGLKLISQTLKETLDIPISVLMGANIAHEVADEMFCETTIGCSEGEETENIYKLLFSTSQTFELLSSRMKTTVEICGAFKKYSCGRRVAEAFVQSNKSIAELELEMLGGQKLQGPETAAEVHHIC